MWSTWTRSVTHQRLQGARRFPPSRGAWKESRARILRKRRWSATCSFSVRSHHALAVTLVTEKANVDPAECPLLILRLLMARRSSSTSPTVEMAAVGA